MTAARIPAWAAGEFLGTFILVFFGCGSVAASVLTGAQVGIFQVAIIWGIGIATAIYLVGSLSGAHLNPAVTITFATWEGFPWRKVPGYLISQLLGAIASAAVLYAIFSGPLASFERKHAIQRGAPGSEASAMIFGEFFPNPGGKPLTDEVCSVISPLKAFLIEAVGAGILLLVILGSGNPRNASRPGVLAPATIGLTVTALISLFGPLTMAGLNPARDFGPRLFSVVAGWGNVPFSTNDNGWFTVYILAPVAGGLIAGALHRLFLHPRYDSTAGVK
jgi:glycerol uptake facilitator protein